MTPHRWLLALVCTTVGCAPTHRARLYDLAQPDVVTASYKQTGEGRGTIWIGASPETSDCHGEFSTVAGGETGWGTIYGAGGPRTVITATTSGAQRGSAILTCGDGRVIDCEYVAGPTAGQGACQDNRDHHYRLLF